MTIRQRISDAEWQARLDLAACYRLVARYGMADLIYNHITVRVPGEAGHILINPFGYLYEEITASCLYKIDLAGNPGNLTASQFAILARLCRNSGQVVRGEDLEMAVWGDVLVDDPDRLKTLIKRLRRAVDPLGNWIVLSTPSVLGYS